MIAAIHARKSTEQTGAGDEQKSVTRQIDHARVYAASKGWAVDDAHVFVDDGISGAEFATRTGFLRLMNALKPRAPFSALIMSEVSRLGREQIEMAYALKQLSVAGVRCFSYLEDRELLMESATDKFLLGAVTFAADLEREKARQRTYDALLRKAKAREVLRSPVRDATVIMTLVHERLERVNVSDAEECLLDPWQRPDVRVPIDAVKHRGHEITDSNAVGHRSAAVPESRQDRGELIRDFLPFCCASEEC